MSDGVSKPNWPVISALPGNLSRPIRPRCVTRSPSSWRWPASVPTSPATGGCHRRSGPAGGSPSSGSPPPLRTACTPTTPPRRAEALAQLIDLACATRGTDYFRSEDPVTAAGFVVSDAAAELWAAIRRRHGFQRFAETAAPQLIRWESSSGWTRYGDGPVAAKETTLAVVLAGLLKVPDAWAGFAEQYRHALGSHAPSRGALAEWNRMLAEHLAE